MHRSSTVSPTQTDLLSLYREKWLSIGLNTDPADRDIAEHGVAEAYSNAGLSVPHVVFASSPMAIAVGRALLLNRPTKAQMRRIEAGLRTKVDSSDWDRFWDGVQDCFLNCRSTHVGPTLIDALGNRGRDVARAAVRRRAGADLWHQASQKLAGPIRARVSAGVWANVGRGIWASVRGSVASDIWGGFRTAVHDAIHDSLHGQHDANWLGFYDFFRTGLGFRPETDALKAQISVATSAGWWLPHQDVCWISERPCLVRLDEGGALHAPDGPALVYPDGWSLYAWRGTLVPRIWIERPEALTPKMVLAHPHLEQRRAACEILGWEKVLSALKTRRIEADADPAIGELVEVDFPELGRERFLRVTCGTGRRFALPVPPTVTTALAANAWTYGLDADLYKPEVRT